MADKPTQEHRELAIGTPLGEDVLLLISMSGRERLGELFEYQLELASQDPQIKAENIIGENVTIRLNLSTGKARYFNGYVNSFTRLMVSGQLARYRATVVPQLWFLSRKANCRIFQEKTVPNIIKEILRNYGITNIEDCLSSDSYRTWEYCVQYRETDLAFISRLMEQEGIYYYFKHENGKHKLVLADSANAHAPNPEFEELIYHPADKGTTTEECISDWVVETHLQPDSYAIEDFNFINPETPLSSRANASSSEQQGSSENSYEIYDYPGEYTKTSEGDGYAKRRIEEIQAQYKIVVANSDSRGICPGYLFKLIDHPINDQNQEYLITSANYKIEGDEIFSSGAIGSECIFSCNFTAIKSSTTFRSPRITPKPLISGPQTAFVVGPEGHEIHTDKYGRVKVIFHWDHHNKPNNRKPDENSSCWIRVAQVWAGKNWGAMYIPRIGQEVIVEFLEGNPDRPIITGRVYNAKAMPPYDLPGNKTMSTLKSNSSEGGEGFNEIRFEDKKGEEQIFIHAEKNLDIRVKSDRFETIENNRHLHVVKDKFEYVENNRDEKVDVDHKETIGKDRHLKVKGKEAKEVGGSLSLTVKGDVIEAFNANHSEETTRTSSISAASVKIEGKSGIELKCGGSSIVLTPAAVFVTGSPMVNINSGSGPPVAPAVAMGVTPAAADKAQDADVADPGKMAEIKTIQLKTKTGKYGSQKVKPFKPPAEEEATVAQAAQEEEQKTETTWIEIELVGEDDKPIPGEKYKIKLPDDSMAEGTLDEKGFARVEGFKKGDKPCKVCFPNLDKDAWKTIR